MDILQLIDRLEELFNDAKAVPFTHNVVIDEDRMLEIIDQMRIVIPDEVKKAQQIAKSAGSLFGSSPGRSGSHHRARPRKSRTNGNEG